jgi:hypothetical protein
MIYDVTDVDVNIVTSKCLPVVCYYKNKLLTGIVSFKNPVAKGPFLKGCISGFFVPNDVYKVYKINLAYGKDIDLMSLLNHVVPRSDQTVFLKGEAYYNYKGMFYNTYEDYKIFILKELNLYD